jgi:hypothetical protein
MDIFRAALFIAVGCATNLVTGRKQLSLVSESELQVMAVSQYRTFLTENKVVTLQVMLKW